MKHLVVVSGILLLAGIFSFNARLMAIGFIQFIVVLCWAWGSLFKAHGIGWDEINQTLDKQTQEAKANKKWWQIGTMYALRPAVAVGIAVVLLDLTVLLVMGNALYR